MQTTTTRRAILAGLAAAPVAPAADPALAAIAEWSRACAAAAAAMESYRAAATAGDSKPAEDYFSECNCALFATRDAALKTAPTTVAGAVVMMRFLAGQVDDLAEDPDHRPALIAAIRAAADAIEEARS